MKASARLEPFRQAHQLAFGPLLFQAVVAARNLGVLGALDQASEPLDVEGIATRTGLSRYAAVVLLDACASIDVATESPPGRYTITRTGRLVLNDRMTRVHMDFTNDVCYSGAFDLEASLREGRPAGLAVFGSWPTIYEALAHLPPKARASWFAFDHYWSDSVFPKVLPLVFRGGVGRLLDVGGNTGRWTRACLQYDPHVAITLLDHPGQLDVARGNVGDVARFEGVAVDLLNDERPFPTGFDVVFMSQFLDCFSEEDVTSLLRRGRDALKPGGRLFVLETYTDRQPNDIARMCLHATSVYFACMANGNSRMYRYTDLARLIDAAGLEIETDAQLGVSHTLLGCRVKGAGGSA